MALSSDPMLAHSVGGDALEVGPVISRFTDPWMDQPDDFDLVEQTLAMAEQPPRTNYTKHDKQRKTKIFRRSLDIASGTSGAAAREPHRL
eukprot:m.182075 g.182075  ORF g.182075 m.182075 type:complete len:90 (-) comp10480_c0_seq2:646-915(-)